SGTTVLEGHATWADRLTTTRLYGAPVDNRQLARRSWRYRLHAAVPGIDKISPQHAQYEQWARLITEAVGLCGTDVVNRVWSDAALLPAAEEIADPDTWARRLAASPAGPGLAAEPAGQS
ncbi:MAG TPA: zinc-dependent metalloprotease, partial [Streptomyces sp.]